MSRFSVCFRHECVCVCLGVFVCLIVFVTNCCEPVCVLALRVVSMKVVLVCLNHNYYSMAVLLLFIEIVLPHASLPVGVVQSNHCT